MAVDVDMDGYLDGLSEGFAGRLEVIEGRTGRRRWTEAEKARIVVESLVPGARGAEVARRHGTTRWQVYDWRRRLTKGLLELPPGQAEGGGASFAPVVVEPEAVGPATPFRGAAALRRGHCGARRRCDDPRGACG
jgi:transposase